MTAAEILEAMRRLPALERRELAERFEIEFSLFDDELTPEQIAELKRRAEWLRADPKTGMPPGAMPSRLPVRQKVRLPSEAAAALEPYIAAAKRLPFAERLELAHRLWDEFMDGFKDLPAPPLATGAVAWRSLKAEIDALQDSASRLEFAQQVWRNIQETGHNPEPMTEPGTEPGQGAEESLKTSEGDKAFAEVFAEISQRSVSAEELKAGEGAAMGRRLQEHLHKPEPVISFDEAKAALDAKYGK